VDLFVAHQANIRIIEAAQHRMGLPDSKVVKNIHEYGNTTAATIPLALATALDQKALARANLVLLAAVGAGFTVGTVLLRWSGVSWRQPPPRRRARALPPAADGEDRAGARRITRSPVGPKGPCRAWPGRGYHDRVRGLIPGHPHDSRRGLALHHALPALGGPGRPPSLAQLGELAFPCADISSAASAMGDEEAARVKPMVGFRHVEKDELRLVFAG
jgi:hypothetical protein